MWTLVRPPHPRADRVDLVRADHRDRDHRHAGLQRHPGHAGLALVQPPVRRPRALRVDAQQLALAQQPDGGVEGGLRRRRARPVDRHLPDPDEERLLDPAEQPGSVKYSRLARNVIRRGTSSGRRKESATARWLLARIAPPRIGTCSRPSIVGRVRHASAGRAARTSTTSTAPDPRTPHVDSDQPTEVRPAATTANPGARHVRTPRRRADDVREWAGPRRDAATLGGRVNREPDDPSGSDHTARPVRGDRRRLAPRGRRPHLARRRAAAHRAAAHPDHAHAPGTARPAGVRPPNPRRSSCDHFVPPEPPPLPRIGPPALVGFTLLALGLTLVTAPDDRRASRASTGCRSACWRSPRGWAGWCCGCGPGRRTTGTRTTTARSSERVPRAEGPSARRGRPDVVCAARPLPRRDEFRPGRGSVLVTVRTSYDAARHETPRRTP